MKFSQEKKGEITLHSSLFQAHARLFIVKIDTRRMQAFCKATFKVVFTDLLIHYEWISSCACI